MQSRFRVGSLRHDFQFRCESVGREGLTSAVTTMDDEWSGFHSVLNGPASTTALDGEGGVFSIHFCILDPLNRLEQQDSRKKKTNKAGYHNNDLKI